MPGDREQQQRIQYAVESARNLIPSAYNLVVDSDADMKDRWDAFEKIYAFVEEEFEKSGAQIQSSDFEKGELTAQQIETISQRSKRYKVAATLLTSAYGTSEIGKSKVMWEAENLVPTQPDPETLRPSITLQDQVILHDSVKALFELLPEEMDCFYKSETESVERRRFAFLRIYAMVGAVWREKSLFARSLSPELRKRHIILALMIFVPRDQWTPEDLQKLNEEMLPIEEPDWEALKQRADK